MRGNETSTIHSRAQQSLYDSVLVVCFIFCVDVCDHSDHFFFRYLEIVVVVDYKKLLES